VEYLFPNRRCPVGTVEATPGECLPIAGAAGTGLNLNIQRCRSLADVYVAGKGCVPLASLPCLPGDYRDPTTGKCTPSPLCGDEEPGFDGRTRGGTGYTYKHTGMPPKCVLRCPPGKTYYLAPGQGGDEGTCVDKEKDTGLLGRLLLGAGGGFAIGGPPGAAAGAIAAYFLLGKK
jgi:hypothetical protein